MRVLAWLKLIWGLIKEVFLGWYRDDASQLAAALAFYAVLSFAPTVVIVVAIAGAVFGNEAVEGELVSQTQAWIGERGAEFLQESNRLRPEKRAARRFFSGKPIQRSGLPTTHVRNPKDEATGELSQLFGQEIAR